MGSSTSKGNISIFLLVIALLVIMVLIVILAELMISDGVRSGKYINPNVATHVVRGTIYDRNGRVLALEVAKTAVLVKKDSANTDEIAQILSISTGFTPDEIKHAMLLMRELGYARVQGFIWAAETNELIRVEL